MMRIFLFLLTNLAVMLIFSIVLSITGIKPSSVSGLIIMSGLFGFGGALISLVMSKYMALKSVNGEIISIPKNSDEIWLLETIKKHSRLVGISTPQLAIYQASDINAFATGARRNSSLIAVSTGLLSNMNRKEAEAVIAHEISHISNGDMVTMTLIQGVVNTCVIFISRILAQLVSGFLSNSEKNENDNQNHGNPIVYFIISTVLEILFGILASIIILWFSRRREFYADAGSAKIVGKENMILALEKLKISIEPQEPSNMMSFCINGSRKKKFTELFMSHPSLDKRIEALRFGTYFD